MPQVLVLMAAGAGLYTAYKWLSREAEKVDAAARRAKDDLRRQSDGQAAGGPKDLGQLIWDEKSGAYRPKSH